MEPENNCQYCKIPYQKTVEKNDYLFNDAGFGGLVGFHVTDHKCGHGCLSSNWISEPNISQQRASQFFYNSGDLHSYDDIGQFAKAYKDEYIDRIIDPDHLPEYLEPYNDVNRLKFIDKKQPNFSLVTPISINALTKKFRSNYSCQDQKEFAFHLLRLKGENIDTANKKSNNINLGPLVLSTIEHIMTNGSKSEQIDMIILVLRYRNLLMTPGYDVSFAAVPCDESRESLDLPVDCYFREVHPNLTVFRKSTSLNNQTKQLYIGLKFPQTLCDKYFIPTVLEMGDMFKFMPYPRCLSNAIQDFATKNEGIPVYHKSRNFKYYELIHPPHNTAAITSDFFDQNQITYDFFYAQEDSGKIEQRVGKIIDERRKYKDTFFDFDKLISSEIVAVLDTKEQHYLQTWCNTFKQLP